jgi:hypothetical protein
MKKTLSIILLTCLLGHVYGQLKKGTVQLGGNVSWSTSKNEGTNPNYFLTTNNSSFNSNLKSGIFLTDKAALGIDLGYSNFSYRGHNTLLNQPDSHYTQTQNGLHIGPYYSWYKSLGAHFAFSIFATANYAIGKSTYRNSNGTDVTESKSSYHALNANVAPGITYFLNSHWGLTGSLGSLNYSSMTTKPTYTNSSATAIIVNNANHTTTGDVNLNISSFSLGLQYFITH